MVRTCGCTWSFRGFDLNDSKYVNHGSIPGIWIFCFYLFLHFLLNLLGWHWLTKLYRFQVYSSIMHHLHIVLCVHHPKSRRGYGGWMMMEEMGIFEKHCRWYWFRLSITDHAACTTLFLSSTSVSHSFLPFRSIQHWTQWPGLK